MGRTFTKSKDYQNSYPQKQIKASPVSTVVGLKLVAALKSIHEGTQHLTVKSATVETGLKTSTRIETEEEQWQKVECDKHKDCQQSIRKMFTPKVFH